MTLQRQPPISPRVRRGPQRALLVALVLGYGAGFGTVLFFALRQALEDEPLWPDAIGFTVPAVAAYLLGFAWLLLYAVIDAGRFSFDEAGFSAVTWRGRLVFAWADVRSARLTLMKNAVSLLLSFGRCRTIEIPLMGYHASGDLLDAIERRLPVPVAGSPALRAKLDRSRFDSGT